MADKNQEASKGFELFYVAVAAAWLGSVAMGTNLGYSSPAIPSLKRNDSNSFTLSAGEETWFGSLLTLGALTGGLVAGFLVESLGRKLAIIFSSLGFVVGWLLIATAGTVLVLCLGRVITGFFTGIISLAVPVYVSEISRPEVRGVLGTGIQLSVTIGILAVFFFGKYLNWSSLAILCMTVPAAMAVLMIFMAESPRWLLQKDKRDEALKALQFLYAGSTDHEAERNAIEANIKMSPKESFQMKELQQPFIYKPILISLFLMFAQQFSGINAVMFYAVAIFQSAGTTIPAEDCMVIIGVVQVFATLVATMTMDKGGRRVLLLVSASMLAVSLAILGGYHYVKETNGEDAVSSMGWLPLACLSLFIIGFSFGMGPIPWLMMGELMPSRVRCFATSICTCFNWTLAFVVTKAFNDMLNLLSTFGTYWFFCGCMLLSFVVVVLFLPETKGKTLEEIELAFRGTVVPKSAGEDVEAIALVPVRGSAAAEASQALSSSVPSSRPSHRPSLQQQMAQQPGSVMPADQQTQPQMLPQWAPPAQPEPAKSPQSATTAAALSPQQSSAPSTPQEAEPPPVEAPEKDKEMPE